MSKLVHSVNAEGSFRVEPDQWTLTHCGIDSVTVSFTVRIEGALDTSGYVYDVRAIHGYFRRRYETERSMLDSCERVADQAITYFARAAHSPSCIRVTVRASSLGYAESTWKA